MNTLNKDTTFSIINFLDNKSIFNLSCTNKINSKFISNTSNIIIRNSIIDKWSYYIYDIIMKNDKKNIKKYTKVNMKNFFNIINFFYIEVLNTKNIKTNIFVEIYDIIYNFCNLYPYKKDELFNQRIIFIKKNFKDYINYDHKKVNNIINVSRYLNKYVSYQYEDYDFLTNNDIIDILNLY